MANGRFDRLGKYPLHVVSIKLGEDLHNEKIWHDTLHLSPYEETRDAEMVNISLTCSAAKPSP